MAVRVAPGADSQHTVYAPPERAKYIRGDRQGQPHLSFALAKNRSCETTPYLHTDQSQSPIAHGGQRRITQDEYDKKARELKGRQNEIALRIEQHQEGEGDYRTTLESLISVASRAADIFERSKTEQKRELIAFVFSNLRLKGKKLEYSLRSPFDLMVNRADHTSWLAFLDTVRTERFNQVLSLQVELSRLAVAA
jgi:hypothetical protein